MTLLPEEFISENKKISFKTPVLSTIPIIWPSHGNVAQRQFEWYYSINIWKSNHVKEKIRSISRQAISSTMIKDNNFVE